MTNTRTKAIQSFVSYSNCHTKWSNRCQLGIYAYTYRYRYTNININISMIEYTRQCDAVVQARQVVGSRKWVEACRRIRSGQKQRTVYGDGQQNPTCSLYFAILVFCLCFICCKRVIIRYQCGTLPSAIGSELAYYAAKSGKAHRRGLWFDHLCTTKIK